MLRVTIEIVPYGDEGRKRHIRTLEISRTTEHNDPEDYTVNSYNHDGEHEGGFWVLQHYYADGAEKLVNRALHCWSFAEDR